VAESLSLDLASEAATLAAGAAFARAARARQFDRLVVFLNGELGAGKTSFVRGILRGLGYEGRVPSPTYTLVETYVTRSLTIVHADLYRLSDGAEVEFLALDEAGAGSTLVLVEWPDHGAGYLEAADMHITLSPDGDGRSLDARPVSDDGAAVLSEFARAARDI
jgi:tRNA threonylcarbamoyladenosine biosynthesis protein TsaE